MAIAESQQLYFDGVSLGELLPHREFGPLTIISTVRWAGLQENTARLRYSGKIVEKSASSNDSWVACDLEGKNEDDRQILTGRCTLILPLRVGCG